MSAATNALACAEAFGARFRLAEGGRVRFTAGMVPTEVVAELHAHRAEVAAILAIRAAPPGEHDAAEAAAMVAHYAAPPSLPLPSPDPLALGLLRSARAHHNRPADAAPPRRGVTSGAKDQASWT